MAGKVSFEEKLEKLKKIVEDLEIGDIPLKESIEKFQEGRTLIRECYEELEEAELKVETIIKQGDKIITENLETNENENNPGS